MNNIQTTIATAARLEMEREPFESEIEIIITIEKCRICNSKPIGITLKRKNVRRSIWNPGSFIWRRGTVVRCCGLCFFESVRRHNQLTRRPNKI